MLQLSFSDSLLFESITDYFDAEITFPSGEVKYGVFSKQIETDVKNVVDAWNAAIKKTFKDDPYKLQDSMIEISRIGKKGLKKDYQDHKEGWEFTKDCVTISIKDITATKLISFTKYWKKYKSWGDFPVLITHENERSKIISDGVNARKLV